jgi:hypothetical protein
MVQKPNKKDWLIEINLTIFYLRFDRDYFDMHMSLVCQSAINYRNILYILATFGSWPNMEITFPSPEMSNQEPLANVYNSQNLKLLI